MIKLIMITKVSLTRFAIELVNDKIYVGLHLKLFIANSYICMYMFSCFCCRFDLTIKINILFTCVNIHCDCSLDTLHDG